MACSCYMVGTKVECTRLTVSRNLFREQTWGRAVRAPNNSRELGALLICGGCFLPVDLCFLRVPESFFAAPFPLSARAGRSRPHFAPKLALYIVLACVMMCRRLTYEIRKQDVVGRRGSAVDESWPGGGSRRYFRVPE